MKRIDYFLFFTLLIFSISNSLAQQLNYRAHVGIGFTDMAHIGLTRRIGNLDIGAQVGYLNHGLGRIISGGVSGSLRLGHSKKFKDAPTLFLKQLLNCQNDRNKQFIEWYWLTTEFLLGRNFYMAERFGLSAEGGALVTIYQIERHTEANIVNRSDDDDKNYPLIFPTARIQVFYRF